MDGDSSDSADTHLPRNSLQKGRGSNGASLKQAVFLAVELFAWSICGLLPLVAFWYAGTLTKPMEGWLVSIKDREVACIVNLTSVGLVENIKVESIFFVSRTYLPWMFLLVLGVTKKRLIAVVSGIICGYTAYQFGKNIFHYLGVTFPLAGGLAGILIIDRKRKLLRRTIFSQLACMVGGVGFLYVMRAVAVSDTTNILFACVVFPVFKETFYSLLRYTTKSFILFREPGLIGAPIQKKYIWLLTIWFQLATSLTMRMFFTRFNNPSALAFVIVYQACLEIFLRLTHPRRDQLLENVREKLWPSKNAHIVPASSFLAASSMKNVKNLQPAQRGFHAVIIIGECITEHASILLSTSLIFLFAEKGRVLAPLEYFQSLEGVDTPIRVEQVLISTAAQIAAEIVVDTACFWYELRQGYDLRRVWSSKPRTFGLLFGIAAIFVSSGVWMYVFFTESLSEACLDKNLCYCIADLKPGGYRARYCHFMYPNTSGFPDQPDTC